MELHYWQMGVSARRAQVILLFCSLIACSPRERGDDWGVAEQRVLSSATDLSFEAPGLKVALPVGLRRGEVAVAAFKNLNLGEGAQVVPSKGGRGNQPPGIVAAFGKVTLSQGSSVGALYALGAAVGGVSPYATIRTFARVHPSTSLEGIPARWGAVSTKPVAVVLRFPIPEPTAGPAQTIPSEVRSLAPGRHSAFRVAAGATLRLRPGEHTFDALIVEDGARLEISNTENISRLWVLGAFKLEGKLEKDLDQDNLQIVFADSGEFVARRPLSATLIAPKATVILEKTATPHQGAVFARNVEFAPGARLVHAGLAAPLLQGNEIDFHCRRCADQSAHEYERCLIEDERVVDDCLSRSARNYDHCQERAKLNPGVCVSYSVPGPFEKGPTEALKSDVSRSPRLGRSPSTILGQVRGMLDPQAHPTHLLVRELTPGETPKERDIKLDDKGRFELRSYAPRVQLLSHLEGHAELQRIVHPVPGSQHELNLIHTAARELSGRVMDASNQRPLSGAVIVRPTIRFVEGAPKALRASVLADGSFRLPGVPVGVLEICFEGDGMATCQAHLHSLQSSLPAELVAYPASGVQREAVARANETEDDGRPVDTGSQYSLIQLRSNGVLLPRNLRATAWAPLESLHVQPRAVSDVDSFGRVAVYMSDENKSLFAISSGGHRLKWDGHGSSNGESAPEAISLGSEPEFSVERCDGFFEGRVQSGHPGKVWVGATYRKRGERNLADIWTLAQKDGSFRFDGLCLAPMLVWAVDLWDLSSATATRVQSGDRVEMTLAPQEMIAFISQSAQGAFRVLPEGGNPMGAGTFSGAAFAPVGSRPCIQFSSKGATGYLRRRVSPGDAAWEVPLAASAPVSGVLRIPHGGTVPPPEVVLVSDQPNSEEEQVCGELAPQRTKLDNSGSFLFPVVPAGRYFLTLVSAGRPLVVESVDVRAPAGFRAAFPLEVAAEHVSVSLVSSEAPR